MTKKTNSKNLFLISFLPAIAYWYLEENYPIKIAVTGGLALATLEIILEIVINKHVHTLSKFNFVTLFLLGGLSLLGDEGIWFKLQPAFTGIGVGLFLAYRLYKGKGLLVEMMEIFPNKNNLPESIIKSMEKHVAIIFFFYGLFMIYVAIMLETKTWLFFKTIGFYIVFGVYMLIEFFLIRRGMKREYEKQRQLEAMNTIHRR